MAISVKSLPRVFRLGCTELEDPAPNLPLKDVVRILSRQFPQFRHTAIYDEDAVVEGDKLVYALQLPPPKTNGVML